MNTPNWQHHSKKDAKRKLKPQALRAAKARRRQLINRLMTSSKGRFSRIITLSNTNTNGSKARNQIATC